MNKLTPAQLWPTLAPDWMLNLPGWLEDFFFKLYKCFIYDERYMLFLKGLGNTLLLTFFALMIGIVLGIVAAYGICNVMSKSMGMDIAPGISLTVITAATLFSCAVGVFFGIYPAKKAAKLSPIEALRRN